MNFSRFSLALFSLVLLANAAVAETWQELGTDFSKRSKQLDIIGGAAVLLSPKQGTQAHFFGLADNESKTRIDENTLFSWASITKLFTGIAVLQLVERGKLSLSDPITKYMPEIKRVQNPFENTDEITIKHLLSHSAGFRGPSFIRSKNPAQDAGTPGIEQLIATLPDSKIKFKPGSRFAYSNLGFNFLGEIVKRVTNDDIEVYIEKNIFKPLNMSTAYFDTTPYYLQDHRSNSYAAYKGQHRAYGTEFDTGITTANSGLNASLKDMSAFVNFLIGDEKNPVYPLVLPRKTLEQMWEATRKTEHKVDTDETVGLAFFIRNIQGQRYVGHTGSLRGFVSSVFFNPESRKGQLLVFNTNVWDDGEDGKPKSLTVELYRDLLKRFWQLMG